jgi:hypothetical protein
LKTLNCLSFPDNWKTLLGGVGKKNHLKIKENRIENVIFRDVVNPNVVNTDVDDEPRKPVSFVRSFSVPTPPPLPPPPPLSKKTETQIRENVKKEKQKMNLTQKPKFSISCDDICKQRQLLRRSDDVKRLDVEKKSRFSDSEFDLTKLKDNSRLNSRLNDFEFDLTAVLKRVIDKRRLDSGWIFNDETTSTSSEGQSRCSSRISSNVLQQL